MLEQDVGRDPAAMAEMPATMTEVRASVESRMRDAEGSMTAAEACDVLAHLGWDLSPEGPQDLKT